METEAAFADLRELSKQGDNDPQEEGEEESIDISKVERSGRVCVLGVANSGKSSLVNELVGTKVSIVSHKPQTTRQKVLGLALLSPRPGAPPNTQAIFVDTAGIMPLSSKPRKPMHSGSSRRAVKKKRFPIERLHKAMVKTAWKATRDVEALWWVLDAERCAMYGDYMPKVPELDGIPVGPKVDDAWWLHPELEDELSFLRKLRRLKRHVHVVFNKVDLLRKLRVDVEQFTIEMRERLYMDLGADDEGRPLLQNLWPTSVLRDPESLLPLKVWLCQNLPQQSPIYPVEAVSDVPARVAAAEITREKLFGVLEEELPYNLAVVNSVWREGADGKLQLGQKIVVKKDKHRRIVLGWLKHISEDSEQEISETINFGRPVELHFQVTVDPEWMDNSAYYNDVQGLLHQTGSLVYPG